MSRPKKGTEYVCGTCGTTIVVTSEGCGIMEDIVCCERPMQAKPKKAKPKKASKKKRK